MQQSQGLPRFHDNAWNTQPVVVVPSPPPPPPPPPPPHSHSFLEEEEVELLTACPPDVLMARQEVFVGIAAPAPKYALPVVLREGDGEVEMGQDDGYVDEDDDDDMFEEEEEEECGEGEEGMEDENEEREWARVEQHPQQQRRQQYHDTTTTAPYGNEAAYRPKETLQRLLSPRDNDCLR